MGNCQSKAGHKLRLGLLELNLQFTALQASLSSLQQQVTDVQQALTGPSWFQQAEPVSGPSGCPQEATKSSQISQELQQPLYDDHQG